MVQIGERKNTYRIFVEKPLRKSPVFKTAKNKGR
jgi:hypothetical protein